MTSAAWKKLKALDDELNKDKALTVTASRLNTILTKHVGFSHAQRTKYVKELVRLDVIAPTDSVQLYRLAGGRIQ